MFAIMLISLYTSRIILQNLGIVDFGLYNVVGGVSMMFIFLNTAMNSSTQRYLTIAIGKGDDEELHKIFNVSCVIHTAIGIAIVVLCEIIGVLFIKYKMTIPEGREIAVMWAFQLSLIAAFITIISVPFSALIISRERMGAFAYISIIDVVFKLIIAYVISVFYFDRLIFYAFLIVLSQIAVRFAFAIYCRKKFKECSFKFYKFDSLYREMIIFAAWGMLGHVATIINTSIQDMMLNVFFSPIINAARAVAMRVSNAINSFSENFQTAVSPQITKSWAVGNIDRLYLLIYNSSRFSLYLVWLLSLPVFLCMDDILDMWLVDVPEHTSTFLSLVLIHNLVYSGANPLNMAIRAKGDIKYPEIIGGIILILNLPLSYISLKFGAPAYSVFVIMIFCRVLNQCVRIYYARKYLLMPISDYLIIVVGRPMFVLLISMAIPLWVYNSLICAPLLRVFVITIISLFSILFSIYFAGMAREEKQYVITIVKNKIKW